MPDPSATNNEAASQFELAQEGETAVLSYRRHAGSITFVHTAVPPQLEGKGLGKQLAVAGLQFARREGLVVVPLCPFVASYIKRHPEHLELVREDHRARLL